MQYQQIPPKLASIILLQFDKSINAALNGRSAKKVVFHSEKLSTYRFCDNVWTFLLKNVDFREGNHEICSVQKVKIVACDAKGTGGSSAANSAANKHNPDNPNDA